MKIAFINILFFMIVPVTVSACEGGCIVGVTKAWLANYTTPINNVMGDIVIQSNHLTKFLADSMIISRPRK